METLHPASPSRTIASIVVSIAAALAGTSPLLARQVAPAPGAAPAAEATDAGEADRLREKVRELEARIADLEKSLAAPAGESPEIAELKRRLDILASEIEKMRLGEAAGDRPLAPAHGLGPAASRVYGVPRGVSIGGYGEALYQDFAPRNENRSPSGKIDQFDFLRGVLYTGYKFNDRIVFNSEIEFEHASTESNGAVSVEFAYLDFLLNPHASIRAGMILVPAGFINEMHEPPTYLGSRRPSVETIIEPATWSENGAGLFGEAGSFSYRAYLLTGLDSSGFTAEEGLREGRQGGSEAIAKDFALAARADYRGVPGLLVGAFGYRGGSSQGARAPIGFSVDPNGASFSPRTAPFDATVTLYDLHAEYRARGLKLRALWANGSLDDAKQVNDANGLDGAASVGSRFGGWYAEAGWDLLSRRRGGTASITPFVRYEAYDTQRRVPDEAPRDPDPSPLVRPAPFRSDPSNDVRAWTLGVVYKPISNVSVKLDFQKVTNEGRTGVDQVSFNLGYLF